jgi:hypothetical protein
MLIKHAWFFTVISYQQSLLVKVNHWYVKFIVNSKWFIRHSKYYKRYNIRFHENLFNGNILGDEHYTMTDVSTLDSGSIINI